MMEIELRTHAKKMAAAAAVLFAGAAYTTVSATQFLAAEFAGNSDSTRLQRAAWFDRKNAQYPNSIGRYELLARQSPQSALPWLQSATALNPHVARYWIDLAVAQQSMGDTDAEKRSLARALAADAHTPDIAWQAANLYLAQGSPEDAMKQFRVVLENYPPLTAAAIDTCWKIRPDIDFLLANVVPPAAHVAFLEFLISKNETAAANKVWETMFALQQPVARRDLFDYLRYLILHQQEGQAAHVWQQAAGLSQLAAYQPSSENLLVNGDFSLEILNGGFDWTHHKTVGVSLALDPSETRSGSRSLRITLDGPGIADSGVSQLVSVEPGTQYEFSAFYKAEEMDGIGGMEFAIQDLYRGNSLFMSEDLGNADFWKKVGGRFVTGADTHTIIVRIVRVPAERPIRGKLWIDGLQLVSGERILSSSKESQ